VKKDVLRLVAIGALVGAVAALLTVGLLQILAAERIPAVVGAGAGAIAGVATALAGSRMASADSGGDGRPPSHV
jgi:hypothetical protein